MYQSINTRTPTGLMCKCLSIRSLNAAKLANSAPSATACIPCMQNLTANRAHLCRRARCTVCMCFNALDPLHIVSVHHVFPCTRGPTHMYHMHASSQHPRPPLHVLLNDYIHPVFLCRKGHLVCPAPSLAPSPILLDFIACITSHAAEASPYASAP